MTKLEFLVVKPAISDMENFLCRIIDRLNVEEEKISNLEDIINKLPQIKHRGKGIMKANEQTIT